MAKLIRIEKLALDAHREGKTIPSDGWDNELEEWTCFGLRFLLSSGQMIRAQRLTSGATGVAYKEDGTPATALEREVENRLISELALFHPGAVVVGEETGGLFSETGWCVAIDPIDGTWAFLNGTGNFSTTLTVFRDGQLVISMISNPSTGEIAHTTVESKVRILQISLFGEPDMSLTLPTHGPGEHAPLVHLHPSRKAEPIARLLAEAWRISEVRMVRAPGGSPALALLEAAQGRFVYVNIWSSRATEPYDLAGGVMMVRQAGGQVIDLNGKPINPLSHRGPFLASLNETSLEKVRTLAAQALSDRPKNDTPH